MNEKIQEVFLEVFGNEKLISEFIKIDDIDEMYQFCLNVKAGYTREEFVDFLSEYAELCDSLTPELEDFEDFEELSDSQIESVAGGFNTPQKLMAGTLAALSIFTSSGATHAADVPTTTGGKSYVSIGANHDDYYKKFVKEKQEEKSKIKKKFSKAWKWVRKHKGKIALGCLAVAALSIAVVSGGLLLKKKLKEHLDDGTSQKNIDDFKRGDEFDETVVTWENSGKKDKKSGKEIKVPKLGTKKAMSEEGKALTIETYEFSGLSSFSISGMSDEELLVAAEKTGRDLGKLGYEYTKAEHMKNVTEKNKKLADLNRIKKDILANQSAIDARLKDKSFFGDLSDKLGIVGTVGGGAAALASLGWKAINDSLNWAGKSAKKLSEIIGLTTTINQIWNMVKSVADSTKPIPEFNAVERRKWLQEQLEKIKGQPEVVKEVLSLFDRIVASRELTDASKEEENGVERVAKNRPNFVVFNGTAGTGKSVVAEILAKALSPNAKFEKVMSSSMEKLSKDSGRSGDILSTLLYVPHYVFLQKDDVKTPGNYIKNNPRGVVIIDEYDKVSADFCSDNSTVIQTPEGEKYCNPYDEAFRRIYEDPIYSTSGGTDLDLSEVTFILTSNEYSTMFGKEYDPREGPLNDRTRTSNYAHDGSFLDRIGGNNVITFNALGKKDYVEIGKDKLKRSIDFFGQKKLGQFGFQISEGIYDAMARYIEKQTILYKSNPNASGGENEKENENKAGARGFEKLFRKLDSTIQTTSKNVKAEIEERLAVKRHKKRVSIEQPKYLDFKLDFNEETGEFEVEVARYGNYTRYLIELGDIDVDKLREEIKNNESKADENKSESGENNSEKQETSPENKPEEEENANNNEEKKPEDENNSPATETPKPELEENKDVQEQIKPESEEQSQEVKNAEDEKENNEEQNKPADAEK